MPTVDLLRAIQLAPEVLDRITPREFEAVVAEVLAAFGWDVSPTPTTMDGGRDMLAIAKLAGGIEIRIIVECKRYQPDRRVGVEAVRQLLGIKHDVGVTKGILVTSSRFSADAQRLGRERQYELELVDREKLLEWIQSYSPTTKGQPHLPQQQFDSCFLSHSHQDHEFASMLNSRLQDAGIKVWFAPEDMRPGEKTKQQIDRALAAFDRVIAVLSAESVRSSWVTTELTAALRIELKANRNVLFPVSLFPYSELAAWKCFNSDLGQDVAEAVREYPVLDFSDWRTPHVFERQFAKLLDGLARVRSD